MPLRNLAELKEKFDKSKLPYIVNFTDYNAIDEKFFNLIKDDLVSVEKFQSTTSRHYLFANKKEPQCEFSLSTKDETRVLLARV